MFCLAAFVSEVCEQELHLVGNAEVRGLRKAIQNFGKAKCPE